MKLIIDFLKRPYLAFAYSLLVLGACIMPSENIPEVDDKTAHFVAFAGIAFLWLWYSPKYFKVILLTALFGLLIEFIQGALPESFYRSFDWYDALADGIGAVIGGLLFFVSSLVLKERA